MNKSKFIFRSLITLSTVASVSAFVSCSQLSSVAEVKIPETNTTTTTKSASFTFNEFIEQKAIGEILDFLFSDSTNTTHPSKLRRAFESKTNSNEITKSSYLEFLKNINDDYLKNMVGYLKLYNIPLQESWPRSFDAEVLESTDVASENFENFSSIYWLLYLLNYDQLKFIGTSFGVFNGGGQFGRQHSNEAPWFWSPKSNKIKNFSKVKILANVEEGIKQELNFNEYYFLQMEDNSILEIKLTQRSDEKDKLTKKIEISPYMKLIEAFINNKIINFDIHNFLLLNIAKSIGNDLYDLNISEDYLTKLQDIASLDTTIGTVIPYYLSSVEMKSNND